jgi:hypothetical protein
VTGEGQDRLPELCRLHQNLRFREQVVVETVIPMKMGVDDDVDVFRLQAEPLDGPDWIFVFFALEWVVITGRPRGITSPGIYEDLVARPFDEPHENGGLDLGSLIDSVREIRLLQRQEAACGEWSNPQVRHV